MAEGIGQQVDDLPVNQSYNLWDIYRSQHCVRKLYRITLGRFRIGPVQVTNKSRFDSMTKLHPKDSDFDWLANIYNSHSAINHPSELHGLLLGHLAGGQRFKAGQWIGLVLEHMGAEELDVSRQVHLQEDLEEFCESVDQEVSQDSSSFNLLLPDEDYALSERAEALSIWVRGFLEGIAISASKNLSGLDSDLQELLRDLVSISQMDVRVESSEQGEKELFEVAEYVKIAVLNLYAEFNQPDIAPSEKQTLH